jgi:hypothetical protein
MSERGLMGGSPSPQIEIKKNRFRGIMIGNVTRDLTFGRNQAIKSADD